MLKVLLVGCICLSLSNCASFASKDDLYLKGTSKINSNQFSEGFRLLKICGLRGHGGCAEIVGWEYYDAGNIKQNLDLTIKWLKMAASTKIKYGFAGISGSLSIAEFYCDDSNFHMDYSEIKSWAKNTEALLVMFRQALPESKLLEFESIFKGVDERIAELNYSIDNETCKAVEI